MQDFCFKTTDQGTLIVALDALGLVVDGQVVGDFLYIGKVVKTAGIFDENGNETTAPVYYDDEYAVYRTTSDYYELIEEAANISNSSFSIVDPPTGIPMFGGEWLIGETLTDVKATAITEVANNCQSVLLEMAKRFPLFETLTWQDQVTEATAILQDSDPTIEKYPTIGGIISQTGESWGDFAQSVLTNKENWTAASTIAIGKRQKICMEINACTTIKAVKALDLTISLT